MHHGSVRDFSSRVACARSTTFSAKSSAKTSGNFRQAPLLSPSILRTPSRLKLSTYGVRPSAMIPASDQLPIDVKPHERMRRCCFSANAASHPSPCRRFWFAFAKSNCVTTPRPR